MDCQFLPLWKIAIIILGAVMGMIGAYFSGRFDERVAWIKRAKDERRLP